ncbi:MAG: hypothetical protein P8Y27_03310 [Chromatiaceae bacterium]|jgi:hypothetical protein
MPRLDLPAVASLFLGLLSGLPALAEGGITTGKLSRTIEIPFHRRLAVVRESPGTELAPFSTDGCSGGMSRLWTITAERYPAFAEAHEGVPPWEDCCIIHDRAYHAGGAAPDAEASYAARLAADQELQRCVAATASDRDDVLQELYGMSEAQVRLVYQAIGAAMFQAVRLGGGPCTGLPWRWGYGYPHCWEMLGE